MHNTLKAALLISSALIATPVFAQTQPVPPEHYTLDPRGVDLVTGRFSYGATEVVIGQPQAGGLSYGRTYVGSGGGWRDNGLGTINVVGGAYIVSIGPVSERFTKSGTTFTPASNNGASLVSTDGGTRYVFTAPGGDIYRFTTAHRGAQSPYVMSEAILTDVERVSGERISYEYKGVTYCRLTGPDGRCFGYATVVRLQTISNNFGYQLKYDYYSNDVGERIQTAPWLRLKKVTGINLSVDYCASGVDTCPTFSRVWPSVTYAGFTSTDQSGRATTYEVSGGRLSAVRLPGPASDDLLITYNAEGLAATVTDASGTWSYGYVDSGTTRTTTATGPLDQKLTAISNQSIGRATSIAQATSATTSVTTSYTYDSQNRLQRITQPEGDYAQMTYDARGNVTQTLFVPKAGSGLSNLTTSTTFPATCANPVTCNRPTSTTDSRGAVTDYEWNGTHGGLESITLPAPTTGAARPQTRIAYAPLTAWYKNWSGGFVSYGAIMLPVSTSVCASGSAPSCVGTAAETRTTIAYGSSGVANNLLPTAVTQSDGTGALSITTTNTYTANGDVATVDGSLPGADDTTTYRYDDARQLVGVISPDPDGGGPLLRRAQRLTYNPRGHVTLVEAGTVTGVNDVDWAAFNSLQQQATVYDGYGRPTQQRVQSGGTTYSLSQVSYDAAGRQDCVATRMNPATFDAPPASACDLATPGAFGPDRIAKVNYDAVGRPVSTVSGFGSGTPITESVTYTANGKPQTLTDGNGNVSTMVYDGFDRTKQLRYPNATGGGASTTDYEEYWYDAASNVTNYRNRAGETETTTYDALNRPAQTVRSAAPSTAWTYDNLDQPLTISGNSIVQGYGWDALGRQTHETTPLGTVNYGYDLAGRRTSMQWPDGFWVAYDYNLTGNLTAIRENGATTWQLQAWVYDDLGRIYYTGRANGGVTTVYGYDGANRLTSLSHDVAGTANDLTLNFTYNPAGQIATRTMSNTAYAYTPGAGTTSYANNGRNQVTNVGGTAIGYDGRQNITSAPTGTYGYNGNNELTSATVGGTTTALSYDPAGRLYQSGATRFLYDGAQAIGEYNTSGGLLRRYVPGLGLDNVVTAYEGAGYDRRWLLADERQSVIAITDGSGAVIATNTYDEYGVPSSGNAGRFGYTGQMWLPEAQLYHYRARAYAPTLGRFMQTDPIGYQAGANIYAYVGADPMNWVDPLGLVRECTVGVTYGRRADGSIYIKSVSPLTCDGGGSNPNPPSYIGRLGGGGNIYSSLPGSGFGGPPIQNDPTYALYNNRRIAALEANQAPVWIIMAVFAAPAALEAGAASTFVQIGPRLPFRSNSLTHIFVDKAGHWGTQTASRVRAIQNVATPRNFVRTDQFGNNWYYTRGASTNQIWARSYNGQIVSGGRNVIPR